jgi:hypothetical protein
MLRQTLPDYRLPDAVIDRDLAYLDALGLQTSLNTSLGRDFTLEQLRTEFDAAILAVGLPAPVILKVPGCDLNGVAAGLDFLAEAACGVGARLSGRTLVIGGGNVAMDAARVARRLGSDQITVVCLESPEEIPAFPEEVRDAIAEGIEIHHRWGVLGFDGSDGWVAGATLQRCTRVFDSQGRFSPEYDPSETTALAAGTIIVAIGQRSDAGWKPGDALPDGVFAAGDVVTGPSSIVQAMADGKRAAERVKAFLGGSSLIPPTQSREGVDSAAPPIAERMAVARIGKDPEFHRRARVEPERLSLEARLGSLLPYESTLTREQAQFEAARCLRCQLRAQITPAPLPPDPWARFDLEALAIIPDAEGVLILADSSRKTLRIAGTPNLKAALSDALGDGAGVAYCRWELDLMFTKRESELLQAHLKAFGSLPGGGELDDLF